MHLGIVLLTSPETGIALAQGDDHRQGRHFTQYFSFLSSRQIMSARSVCCMGVYDVQLKMVEPL